MTISHDTAIRNSVASLVTDAIDVGGAGNLILQTAGSSAVATIGFAADAFPGAPSNGTATANSAGTTDDTNAIGGTVALFTIQSGAASDILDGTVTGTGGGGDLEITATVVAAGSVVQLTSLTYTAPL